MESAFISKIGIQTDELIALLFLIQIFLFVLLISVNMKYKRLKRNYSMFMRGKDGQSLERIFAQRFRELERLSETNDIHNQKIDILDQNYKRLFSKYGVEKYDAFDDVGGKMSFVLAMLDKNNTGVILNAIHSRDNCFLYLKEIVKGESYVMLSQEEVEALRKAVNFGLAESVQQGTE